MSQKPRAADNVVPLFDSDLDDATASEEIAIGRSIPTAAAAPLYPAGAAAAVLSEAIKVVMAIGLGSTGKTSLMRWFTERSVAKGSPARLAAVDPENRELRDYFANVLEPRGNDPESTARWLRDFVDRLIATKTPALIDFGGGDTSLAALLREVPDLVAVMEDQGLTPVAIYPLSPRLSDLAPLKALEDAGFQPRATALVLNEGRAETADRERWFDPIRRHSIYRAVIDRGAVEIWMPKLAVAKKVEDRRLRYQQARDGIVPDGRKVQPLGVLDRSSVRNWLTRMDAAFAPIQSWIP
jgi:hypothetical protein